MSIFHRRHSAFRHIAVVLICALVCEATGCVQRRMTIRSNPPGAMVYVDDYEIGTTPVSHDFTYYGTRKIRLVQDGYETLTIYQPMPTPWYDLPGIDFFSENIWPGKIRDERSFDYQMTPAITVPTEQLLGRAEQLRNASRVQPAAAAEPLTAPPPVGIPLPQAVPVQSPANTLPVPAGILPPPGGAPLQSAPMQGQVNPLAPPPTGALPNYGPPGTMAPANGALPNYAPPGGLNSGPVSPNTFGPPAGSGPLPSPSFTPGNTPSGAPIINPPVMPQSTPGTFPGNSAPSGPPPYQPPPFNQPAIPPGWRPIGQAPNLDQVLQR